VEYWHDGEFPGYATVNVAVPGERTFIAVSVVGLANTYLIAEDILHEIDRCEQLP
jgi:hypothetical protein